MKKILSAVLAAVALNAQAADVQIEVSGVQNAQGKLMVALYNSADSYLKKPAYVLQQPAQTGLTQMTISGVAEGEYAMAIFHDANDNQRMDRNPSGMPLEDFAFSNNAQGDMGPPTFASASFKVPAGGVSLKLKFN
ncbi:DUF2141 domain-containing protein [Massilia sp. W12]|uniref:DUF2141 domain-containing protein n=1 Tax=Massilia sp. W12 TaxID=3126507 RepID=UPI0030D30E1E